MFQKKVFIYPRLKFALLPTPLQSPLPQAILIEAEVGRERERLKIEGDPPPAPPNRPVRTWDERAAAADAWPLLPRPPPSRRAGESPEQSSQSVLDLVTETVSSLGDEIESRWRAAARGEWHPGAITPHTYLETALRPRDAVGFAAAGVLPYIVRPGEPGPRVLLARQGESKRRGGSSSLVLLGGKREAGDASAAATAAREAEEETGGLISALRMQPLFMPVLWFPSGRFAAFLWRMEADTLPRAFEVRRGAGAVRDGDRCACPAAC